MRYATALLFSALLLAPACGETESILLLDLAEDQLPGNGDAFTQVEVQAIFAGNPVKDGTRINLSCSGGTFEAGKEERTATVTTMAGRGSLVWYAPAEPGEYRIIASYMDAYKRSQQAQATVLVGDPTPVDGNSFAFSCTAANLGAPRSGEDPVRLPCSLTATGIDGSSVKISPARFGLMAETGTLEIVDGQLFWVVGPNQWPKDVDPEGGASDGEPRWVDPTSGNRVRNPRDGLVSLVVHTLGRPGPQDLVQGEPYVDENDNGQWDPSEPFFDADANTGWTPSQVGVAEARIWRWYRLLLTGPVSAVAPDNAATEGLALWDPLRIPDMPIGGSATVNLVLVDANLNPVASHPGGSTLDTVELAVDNSGVGVTPSRVTLARDQMGLFFDATTGALQGRASKQTYLNHMATQTFTVSNNRSSLDADQPFATEAVNIRRTPVPGGRQITEQLPPATGPHGLLTP